MYFRRHVRGHVPVTFLSHSYYVYIYSQIHSLCYRPVNPRKADLDNWLPVRFGQWETLADTGRPEEGRELPSHFLPVSGL